MKQKLNFYRWIQLLSLLAITLSAVIFTAAQNSPSDQELARAMNFIEQNRHINALPILEKAAPRYPNDGEIQAHFGVAILVNSVTIKDEDLRKKEVVRAADILRKAKKLGTENVIALHYLDKIEEGNDIGVAFNSSSKEVEDAIREGEGFFGRGEYEKAFLAYERAYKLDPQSYDAALFAGDSFYAQKKYKESEAWFAKAAAINPNREQAFRFWADALANQGKTKEALSKLADAFIADPNSRLVFNALIEGVKNYGNRKSSPFIVIPSKSEGEIVIDATSLKAEDGTIHWNRFTETRKTQIENFKRVANGREFVSTVSEDVEALKSVALAAGKNLQTDKTLKLSKSVENLIKLDAIGMLDVYTMLFIHGGASSPEYESFREKNRERMKKFLVDYFAEDNV
jgi:tetratricopeptide (TPR) repeat protein